jgi:hypothetical protein
VCVCIGASAHCQPGDSGQFGSNGIWVAPAGGLADQKLFNMDEYRFDLGMQFTVHFRSGYYLPANEYFTLAMDSLTHRNGQLLAALGADQFTCCASGSQ